MFAWRAAESCIHDSKAPDGNICDPCRLPADLHRRHLVRKELERRERSDTLLLYLKRIFQKRRKATNLNISDVCCLLITIDSILPRSASRLEANENSEVRKNHLSFLSSTWEEAAARERERTAIGLVKYSKRPSLSFDSIHLSRHLFVGLKVQRFPSGALIRMFSAK
jgi:hypothetical protein